MASPYLVRPLVGACKRIKLSPSRTSSIQKQCFQHERDMARIRILSPPSLLSNQRRCQSTEATTQSPPPEPATGAIDVQTASRELLRIRLPRSVQATYLTPLRRKPTYGIPCADLQIRSYSVRNLELAADFAMRAAYYLHLPARGPVPLPRMVERWTVPKGHFVHKKSQENFERITLRRLIQIQDGHPEVVALWLAFVNKHRYYGVGMKANVWEYGGIEVGKDLDEEGKRIEKRLGEILPPRYLEEMERSGGSETSDEKLTSQKILNETETAPGVS